MKGRQLPTIQFDSDQDAGERSRFVWWLMIHPDDPNRAFECFVHDTVQAEIAKGNVKDSESFSMPGMWVRALAHCDGPQVLATEVARRRRYGVTAGAVLVIAHISQSLGAPIRFNTALDVLLSAEERKGLGSALDEIPFTNKGQINPAWNLMRPVAHLWAALSLVDLASKAEKLPPGPRLLDDVFALAASFGDWAKTQRMGRGKQSDPLIDPATMWDFPPEARRLPLPVVQREQLAPWLADLIDNRIKSPQNR